VYFNNESDEILIEKTKKGEVEAFSPLIERYKMLVYRVVYRFVGNRDDAEDLTQEVFIKVYRSIKDFKSGMPFLPWISKIAINQAINFIKRERKKQPESIEWIGNHKADEKDDPVEMIRNKMLKERISRAMEKLPEKDRTIIILRIEEELSYDEISKILKIPKGTVMSRLARAREKLREIFYETQ